MKKQLLLMLFLGSVFASIQTCDLPGYSVFDLSEEVVCEEEFDPQHENEIAAALATIENLKEKFASVKTQINGRETQLLTTLFGTHSFLVKVGRAQIRQKIKEQLKEKSGYTAFKQNAYRKAAAFLKMDCGLLYQLVGQASLVSSIVSSSLQTPHTRPFNTSLLNLGATYLPGKVSHETLKYFGIQPSSSQFVTLATSLVVTPLIMEQKNALKKRYENKLNQTVFQDRNGTLAPSAAVTL